MSTMPSQITSLTIIYSTIYSAADKKNQSSASLAFVWGIHRWPVNSPHKGPVTRKMFPFDDVIMSVTCFRIISLVLVWSYDYNSISDIIVKDESIISSHNITELSTSHEYCWGLSWIQPRNDQSISAQTNHSKIIYSSNHACICLSCIGIWIVLLPYVPAGCDFLWVSYHVPKIKKHPSV